MFDNTSELNWYVLNTKPTHEQRVLLNLTAGGFESFYPQIKSYRINEFSGKRSYYRKSLFPSYIFAKFNFARSINKIKYTRGLYSIVSIANKPCVVEEEIIRLIKDKADENGIISPVEKLVKGDKVTINCPHLKNFIGVFEKESSDSLRIQILLQTVSYQLKLIVDKNLVSKVQNNY
jgi:transcription antitermination factor NusG